MEYLREGNRNAHGGRVWGLGYLLCSVGFMAAGISRATIHLEQYDHRFLWNKLNSIIDIYVPIKTSQVVNLEAKQTAVNALTTK